MEDQTQIQLQIISRLKTKVLERFERLLDAGEMSATDAATCTRLLIDAGWGIGGGEGAVRLSGGR